MSSNKSCNSVQFKQKEGHQHKVGRSLQIASYLVRHCKIIFKIVFIIFKIVFIVKIGKQQDQRSWKLEQKYIFFTFLCLNYLWRQSHSRQNAQQQSYICLIDKNLFITKLQRTRIYFTKQQVNLFMTNQVVTGNAEQDKICSWSSIIRPQKEKTYSIRIPSCLKDLELLKKKKGTKIKI